MSTINRKPFLKYVLESMSDEELETLQALVDGGGVQTPLYRTMNIPSGNRTNITVEDKGVHLCDLEIGFTLFKGYLVYTDDYCALFHFTDSIVMGMFDIEINNLKKYATVSESLTVVEFRAELSSMGAGSANPGLVFTNVTFYDWYSDSTYPDYPFKGMAWELDGITADTFVEVIFGMNEANSGNYAPICETGNGWVTIYSKVNNVITVPVIKEVI